MKRLLAFAIVVMMVFATVPVSVSAAGTVTHEAKYSLTDDLAYTGKTVIFLKVLS